MYFFNFYHEGNFACMNNYLNNYTIDNIIMILHLSSRLTCTIILVTKCFDKHGIAAVIK